MDPRSFSIAEWHTFLRDYSSKFLDHWPAQTQAETSDGSQAEGEKWLGHEPAGADAVMAAEQRLGARLPPTYKNFLMASNGFGSVDYVDLFNVDEIGWFSEREPELTEAWDDVLDEDERQMLRRSLLIARDDGGPGVYWLLHRDDVAEDGEWAVHEWFPGSGASPGDDRYDHFGALLLDATRRIDDY